MFSGFFFNFPKTIKTQEIRLQDVSRALIYEVIDLESARSFLASTQEQNSVALTNSYGACGYYGIRVIDQMFNILKKEFSSKIDFVFFSLLEDDYASLIAAKRLGYEDKYLVISNF